MAKNQRKNIKVNRSVNEPLLPFTKMNYLFFTISLITITIGYVALGSGQWDSFASLNIAPILLVLGYCVLIPISILYKKENSRNEN
jgi:lipoprotein signal peptidase